MNKLFNSYSLPIPPIRFDIQRIPVQQNGHSLIHFFDSMGYATPDFVIPSETETILSLIDGSRSVEDILKFSSDEVTKEQILGYARFLDEHGLLQSEYLESLSETIEAEYERSSFHPNSAAGISYPADADKLKIFLDNAFDQYNQSNPVLSAKALYAPHIDPRVGMSSYVKAFSAIKSLKPKRIVILGTSHYSGLYGNHYEDTPFIVSNKIFLMPNGDVISNTTDLTLILNRIQTEKNIDAGVSFQDRAHRIEHSIELHLLFLNYIWDHEFAIIPIVIGSLDELLYSKNSFREQQLDTFSSILKELYQEDTFFLISGDLSHIGYKFGDQKEASNMFDEVKLNDDRFMNSGISGNPDKLISLMKEEFDPYRICGFPPLLTFLKAFPNLNGEILSYDLWDERERESAVSFGSILFQ
ncbi:MAG: AmmeMemoRadiSam system protein B [Balneolaceae bacterium]